MILPLLCYRSRAFVRWMHGTCVETAPQPVPGSDTPYVFSFQPDVANHPDVVDLANKIIARGKDILTRVQRYFLRWAKHKPVWVVDKVGYVCAGCYSFVRYPFVDAVCRNDSLYTRRVNW